MNHTIISQLEVHIRRAMDTLSEDNHFFKGKVHTESLEYFIVVLPSTAQLQSVFS